MASVYDGVDAVQMFIELFTIMCNETPFGKGLKEKGLTVLYDVHDPETKMYLDGDNIITGTDCDKYTPMLIMSMSADTVHKYWLKKLALPIALAKGRIKTKGPMNKMLALTPIMKPGFEVYPKLCKKYGVPIN